MSDETAPKTEDKRSKGNEKQETAKAGNGNMHIKVYAPYKVYFDEDAKSISGANATGPFDILSRHHNFITLLSPCELAIQKLDGSQQLIRISRGIMHVKADQVIVFLDV